MRCAKFLLHDLAITASAMRFLSRLFVSLSLLFGAPLAGAQRVPWTTSRVHGSPEPPAPYRVERAFPKITFAAPLDVVALPNTNRLVVVEQKGRLLSLPNDESCENANVFAE